MFKRLEKEVWAFDVEWVPDPHAGRILYNLPIEMEDRAVIEEMWKQNGATEDNPQPYLKTIMCRVVSVSAVVRRESQDRSVSLILNSSPKLSQGNLKADDISEKEIIGSFLEGIGKHKPQLVGYNSRSADIPILVQRGIINGLRCASFCKRPDKPWEGIDYFRGEDFHIDLLRVLVDFGGRNLPSLHETAVLSGIPGKLDVDGNQVVDLWLKGQVDSIVAYNECDALTTYLLWLRIAHFAGFFRDDEYEDEIKLVEELIENKVAEGAEHLRAFKDEWDRLRDFWDNAFSCKT